MENENNVNVNVEDAVKTALQEEKKKKKKKKLIILAVVAAVIALIIIISAASGSSDDTSGDADGGSAGETIVTTTKKEEATAKGCEAKGCKNDSKDNGKYCEAHQKELEKKIESLKGPALAKLNKNVDSVENITWYEPDCAPEYADVNALYAYIGVQNGTPWLRFRGQYTGDDWIFHKSLTINIDGQVYTKTLSYFSDIVRDNDGGVVWEHFDVNATNYDIEILEKIAASKKTVVRFQGDDYHYDYTVKANEKSDIKVVLNAYNILTGNIDL